MDFMAQVQSYVMSQQYESLLKKANFKGNLTCAKVGTGSGMAKDDVIQMQGRSWKISPTRRSASSLKTATWYWAISPARCA
jgi:hypothetical protein